MSNEKPQDNDSLEEEVKNLLRNKGYEVFDNKGPSLNQIIKSETSAIVKQDPTFFQKYGIHIPKEPEERIFDLYYPDGGKDGFEYVINATKSRYQMLRHYLIDDPNEEKLQFAISEIKQIFQGPPKRKV
jgi:hypothetical protein